jgi:CheY-like chemotaxis protein
MAETSDSRCVLSMPGMTGSEFMRHVRGLPGQRERPTPAIALTAFGASTRPRERIPSVPDNASGSHDRRGGNRAVVLGVARRRMRR